MAEHCPACGEKLGPDAVLTWGGYGLDESQRLLSALVDDNLVSVRLTGSQCDLMAALIRGQGRLQSKERLWNMMYARRPDSDWPDMKIVDVQKFKTEQRAPFIRVATIWGRGYMLIALDAPIHEGERRAGKDRRFAAKLSGNDSVGSVNFGNGGGRKQIVG